MARVRNLGDLDWYFGSLGVGSFREGPVIGQVQGRQTDPATRVLAKISVSDCPVELDSEGKVSRLSFLLRLDVGFQLSFLAIMGIIYLQPTFSDWFSKIPNPGALPLRATLATTISAQVFTLPILVYNFGYIPLISPLTNILIVPFLAPFTILIFIFGLSAILFWPLGSLLSFPAWLSLTYIVKIISYFSKFPFVSLTFRNLHWIWLIIFYFLLGFIIWRLREREKLKFLKY